MLHFRVITLCVSLWLLMGVRGLAQPPERFPSAPSQQDIEATPDEFVLLDEQPTPLNMDEIKRAIVYPQRCLDNGMRGKVILRVLIDQHGKYVKHKVLRTPHPWFTEEVERHISQIRFTPAIQNGRAIVTWVTVPFDFQLILPNDSTATPPPVVAPK